MSDQEGQLADEGHSRNAPCALILIYYYYWIDISAGGGLLVPEGIIRPVDSVSVLIWFISYTYH